MSSFLPAIAFISGYLITWFLFGINVFLIVPLLLIGAGIFAFAEQGTAGVVGFTLSFLLSVNLIPLGWSIYHAMNFDAFTGPNPGNSLAGKAFLYVYGILIISLIVLSILSVFIWITHWSLETPLDPWLYLMGVAVLAFWPVVPLDGRAVRLDYPPARVKTIYRKATRIDDSNSIKDYQELPVGFEPTGSFIAIARCSVDRAGRPRPLSFRASDPLLLVVLFDHPIDGFYAALFDPKTHRKLTRWHSLPRPYIHMRSYHPYLLTHPYYERPHLPAELEDDLRRK
ncbi:hypothetical protein [Deinococcus ruber]|uniref:hypothetical protein n=1 Tax=Deinococcus ruber TaxID=1848197 RepID=UPI00166EA800|nr:hypothetical protein [Deinococcus ruber]